MSWNFRWPWAAGGNQKDITDRIVQTILNAAVTGPIGVSGADASVVQGAATLASRTFSRITVTGTPLDAIDVPFLALAGRLAILRGEMFADVEVKEGRVVLQVAQAIDAQLGPDLYRLRLAASRDGDPGEVREVTDPLRCLFNPVSAYRGINLWGGAATALVGLEHAIWQESLVPVKRLFAKATGGNLPEQQERAENVDRELRRLEGGGIVSWLPGQEPSPMSHIADSFKPQQGHPEARGQRMGFEGSNVMAQLLQELRAASAFELGLSPAVVYSQQAGAGAALQTAYRRWTADTLEPMVKTLQDALRRALNNPGIALALPVEIIRADITATSRAAASLIGAGVDEKKALQIVGLDEVTR